MATYKTKDGTQTGFVPGIGEIVDGKVTVPNDIVIENANLERVEDQPSQAAPVSPPQAVSATPAPVPQAAPSNEQPLNKETE